MDDLVEIGDLENYVRSTSCMLLFLSKGYFRSRNCLREIQSTVRTVVPTVHSPCTRGALTAYLRCTHHLQVVESKPFVLVHETDQGKGGLPLDESRVECPAEMRNVLFTYSTRAADGGAATPVEQPGAATARQVVAWHRVRDFQLLSLRLICSEILHATPYYLNIAQPGQCAAPKPSQQPVPPPFAPGGPPRPLGAALCEGRTPTAWVP